MKIGIIGHGRFGALWAQLMGECGDVIVFDQQKIEDVPAHVHVAQALEDVCKVDVLFLAVPIGAIKQTCQNISEHVLPATIVADVASVKTLPAQWMNESLSENQPLVATHPLFGPDSAKRTGSVAGFDMVVCPLRLSEYQKELFVSLLQKLQLNIIETTPEEHDRQMASSQALVHFLGRGLGALDLREQDIATPDYEALCRINDLVNNDTWELFFDMQRYNPQTTRVRKRFVERLVSLEREIVGDDETIESLRGTITAIDEHIIELISQRLHTTQKIGERKKAQDLPVFDAKREEALLGMHMQLGKKVGVSGELIADVFKRIISESKAVQERVR